MNGKKRVEVEFIDPDEGGFSMTSGASPSAAEYDTVSVEFELHELERVRDRVFDVIAAAHSDNKRVAGVVVGVREYLRLYALISHEMGDTSAPATKAHVEDLIGRPVTVVGGSTVSVEYEDDDGRLAEHVFEMGGRE
jgi:hypothetical protein